MTNTNNHTSFANTASNALDISTIPLRKLFDALALEGGSFKFASSNGQAFVSRDEHATLSAPVSVTL